MVRGDDFVAVGSKKGTRKLQKPLKNAYKVKCEILGAARTSWTRSGFSTASSGEMTRAPLWRPTLDTPRSS